MTRTGACPDLSNPALNKVAFEQAPTTGVVRLIADGVPLVTIVIPIEAADPTGASKTSADDLAEGFRLVTGTAVPIVRDGTPVTGSRILLGAVGQAAGATTNGLPTDGFRVVTVEKGVAIVDSGNGLSYGVCDFQERVLGIRWYYPGPDGTVARPIRNLSLPACAYTDYPRQGKRFMWPPQAKGIVPNDEKISFGDLLNHPVFMSMVRHLRTSYAGPAVGCHTFPNLGMYATNHPECFELSAGGQRAGGDSPMPCYGNPATLKLHIDAVTRFYATGDTTPWLLPPERKTVFGAPLKDTVGFSPLDVPLSCRCDFCKSLIDPKGGPWGEYSRVVATFVAGMAREVKARWPEKILTFLPYQNYTEPPEGIEFPDNVHVQVCLMNGVGMTKEPVIAEKYARWIKGWRRITGHQVQLWEYIIWPDEHSLPILCLHTVKDFKLAHVNDSIGSFINGPYAGPTDLPGGTWACGHPTIYGMYRLLWNPDYDVDAMLDEYARLMYGPAAKPMADLLNLLQDRWEKTRWSRVPVDSFHGDLKLIHEETMPPASARKLGLLLAKARQRAGNSGLYRRRVDFFGRAVDVFMKESAFYHEGSKQPMPALNVTRTAITPVCDGVLDEPCWQGVVTQSFQRAFLSWKSEPDQATTVSAVWCPAGIAIAIRAQEPSMDDLRLAKDAHNGFVSGDVVEIFMDFQGRGTNCYQLIANARGDQWDMFYVRSTPDGKWENWRCGLQGVKVGGVRAAGGWVVEAFVPFASLDPTLAPKAGDTWKVNFTRTRRAADDYAIQRWSTRYKPANNDTESMGTLRFLGER